MNRLVIAVILLVALPIAVEGQSPAIRYVPDPDLPLGERNPDGPEALAEYEFLVGSWDVDIDIVLANGEPLAYRAHWHNRWALDGMAIMQEWRGPFATGMEMRTYNPETGQWEGFNYYPSPMGNGWLETRSQRFEDRMEIVAEQADELGTYLSRETYTDITPDRMRMYSEISRDGGASWQPGSYSMVITRRE